MTRDLGFDVTSGLDTVRDHMADLAAIGSGDWSWWALSRRGCDLNGDRTRIASVYDRYGNRPQLNAATVNNGPKPFRGFPTGGDYKENDPTTLGVTLAGTAMSGIVASGWCGAIVYTRGGFTGNGDGLFGLASGGWGNLQLRGGVLQSFNGSGGSLLAVGSPGVNQLSWAVWGYTPGDTTMRILTPGGMVSAVVALSLSSYVFQVGGAGATINRGYIHDAMFTEVGLTATQMEDVGQVLTNVYGL